MGIHDIVKDASKGAAVVTAGTLIAQGIAAVSIPTVMASTGTVVAGVGTMHGAVTAAVAGFAVAPILVPFAVVGAVVGVYVGMRTHRARL
jgi:hypothetical protein